MGNNSIEERSQDSAKLLNYGFNSYKVNVIKSKKESLGKVKVEKGKIKETDVYLVNDAVELLNVNEKSSKYHFKLSTDKIVAPIKKGDIIGNVKIFDENDKLINKIDITVNVNIQKATLWDLFIRNLKMITTFK